MLSNILIVSLIVIASTVSSYNQPTPEASTDVGSSGVGEFYHYENSIITAYKLNDLQASGKALHIVTNDLLAEDYAFDDFSVSEEYVETIALEKRHLLDGESLKYKVSVPQQTLIAGCPNISYGSRDYVNANCGGDYLSILPNDLIPNFGSFGKNDKISSYTIAPATTSACLITKRYFNNANYDVSGGTWTVMGAFNTYTSGNFNSAQNDLASSEKSTCS